MILSFDVGIKNLAFCILQKSESPAPEILEWDVLNVITGSEASATSANIPVEKIPCSMCKRKAMYVGAENRHFCTSHKTGIVATAAHTPEKFLKQSKSALEEFCKTNGLEYVQKASKTEIVQQIIWPWIQPRLVHKIGVKTASATTAPTTMTATYIQMGRFIDTMLRPLLQPYRESISAIIIENQMAERMHMIQGMLTQFCIGFFPMEVTIEFIAPSNKLKPATMHPAVKNVSSVIPTKTGSAKYRQNKKDGIQRCREWMEHEYSNTPWKTLWDKSSKKDDLADSYLQGIWYLTTVLK